MVQLYAFHFTHESLSLGMRLHQRCDAKTSFTTKLRF